MSPPGVIPDETIATVPIHRRHRAAGGDEAPRPVLFSKIKGAVGIADPVESVRSLSPRADLIEVPGARGVRVHPTVAVVVDPIADLHGRARRDTVVLAPIVRRAVEVVPPPQASAQAADPRVAHAVCVGGAAWPVTRTTMHRGRGRYRGVIHRAVTVVVETIADLDARHPGHSVAQRPFPARVTHDQAFIATLAHPRAAHLTQGRKPFVHQTVTVVIAAIAGLRLERVGLTAFKAAGATDHRPFSTPPPLTGVAVLGLLGQSFVNHTVTILVPQIAGFGRR